jgi:hypothetical protein
VEIFPQSPDKANLSATGELMKTLDKVELVAPSLSVEPATLNMTAVDQHVETALDHARYIPVGY